MHQKVYLANGVVAVPPNVEPAQNALQPSFFGNHFDEPEADVRHAHRKPGAWLPLSSATRDCSTFAPLT